MPDQPEHALHLQGEIDTLRTTVVYEAASDPENVIALGRRALATTPRAWYYVRSIAWLYLAVAYQMAGRLDQAYAALSEGEPEDVAEDGAVHAGGGLTLFHRVDGGGFAGDTAVGHPFSCCQRDPSPERIAGLGALSAQQLLPTSATICRSPRLTQKALEEVRYLSTPMAYLQSAFIYASICQARGLPDQARRSSI